MPVSSAPVRYRTQVNVITRDDYGQLKSVWDVSDHALSNSRSPSSLVGAGTDRNIQIFKLFDEAEKLVAYFPFEEKSFLGIRIIQPAFYELTLDMIDIAVVPEWKDIAPGLFLDWLREQKNTASYLFMCNENSLIASEAKKYRDIDVEVRGKYFYLDLPESFESFLQGLSRPVRRDARKILRGYEGIVTFEVLQGDVFGDDLAHVMNEFFRLHKCIFPNNSEMLPHRKELSHYIEKGISEGVVAFTCAREISTGELVAVDLVARSPRNIGLIQNGRRVEEEYTKVGSWLLLQTIKWSMEQDAHRFEFLLGDQEYKRRLATDVLDAVSLTHFSSHRARLTFRIRHRLGRYLKILR